MSNESLFFNFFFSHKDDPEIPFTEEDYRRRKAHSNFKAHTSAEKLVIKLGKTVSLENGRYMRYIKTMILSLLLLM